MSQNGFYIQATICAILVHAGCKDEQRTQSFDGLVFACIQPTHNRRELLEVMALRGQKWVSLEEGNDPSRADLDGSAPQAPMFCLSGSAEHLA
jgi:hypothetical protein